jgi:hypothetical protein
MFNRGCGPWTVRVGRGPGSRPALEVYEAGALIDVMVATSLVGQIVRGARGAVVNGRHRAVAWGRFPDDGRKVAVAFSPGRGLGGMLKVGRPVLPVETTDIASLFWVAAAAGRFSRVTVMHHGRSERFRIRVLR